MQAAGNTCCKFMTCHNSCSLSLCLRALDFRLPRTPHFCRIPFRVATRQVLLSQLVSVATVCGRQVSSAQFSSHIQFATRASPTKLTLSQFQSCQHNWGHLHVPNSQKKQVATATRTTTNNSSSEKLGMAIEMERNFPGTRN